MQASTTEDAREARLRRLALREGFTLHKSRLPEGAPTNLDDYGAYMLVNTHINRIECGCRYDLDLDAVERFLTDEA